MTITTAGVLEHIAPTSIEIEENVREALDLPKAFVQSITQHGVLQPVLAYRTDDGTLRVRDGQRRVLAAREAGIAAIPAYVAATGADAKARIVQQIVANDQRDGLTERDRVAGYAVLALEGMSVTAIAKATGDKRERVKLAVEVANSQPASEALATGQISLEDAAILAEFQDDAEASADLAENIGRDLEWIAKHWRSRRENEAKREALSTSLRNGTVPFYEEDTELPFNEELTRLSNQPWNPEQPDATRPEIKVDEHTECPGHAVTISPWNNSAMYICTKPEQHYRKWGRATEKVQRPELRTEATDTATQEEATEAKRAERAEVIRRNREWRDAEPVRREWLQTFLARKTMPKDAAEFAANMLASRVTLFGQTEANMARTLSGSGTEPQSRTFKPEPGKPVHALVTLAFAAVEAGTDVQTWRRRGTDQNVVTYLTQIAEWGYALTEVEQIAAGIRTAD